MSRYRPRGSDEKLTVLPDSKITLELPAPGSFLEEKLKEQYESLFASELGDWDNFIRPFKKRDNLLEINRFALESVQRANRARAQVVETNESPFLFVYGDQAEVYTFSLQLLDGGKLATSNGDVDWLNSFEDFYTAFKAQTIADYRLRLSVHYKNNEYVGVWLNMDVQETSEFDTVAMVSFQFYCTKKIRFGGVKQT